MTDRRHDWLVTPALVWIQVTFGAFHVFGKYVVSNMDPMAVAGLRVLGATPLLLLLAWKVDRIVPKGREMFSLALLGFLGVFANQLLFINGLKFTTATNVGILMPAIPVFTCAIAALFGVERIRPMQILGVALAVAGALVMLNPFRFKLGNDTTFGNLLIVGNCLAYAGYLVLQRPVLRRLPPLTVVAYAFLFGGLGVLAVSDRHVLAIEPARMPALVWVGIAYSVLFQTTINYALTVWVMKRSTPSVVSSFNSLQPLVAAILAAIFLGETFGWREAAGFVLIVGGLLFVTRQREAAPAAPAALIR